MAGFTRRSPVGTHERLAQQRVRDDSKADRQAMTVCHLAGRLALWIPDATSQTRMRASVVVMSDPPPEYPTNVLSLSGIT